jgi:Methyltransferase domain
MMKRIVRGGISRIRRTLNPPPPDPLAWRKSGVPRFDWMTHDHASDFYLPPLAGASTFREAVSGAATIRAVLAFLDQVAPDVHIGFLKHFYTQGLERFGDSWVFADINTVLWGLTSRLPVTRYLEIGVRRGKSVSIVATHRPDVDIDAFDMWIENYAGMENPGKELVRSELAKVGHRGKIEFHDGDSAVTVPRFIRENPKVYFDLITVDGDHTLHGARRDLLNVIPRLKIGGIVVFDDISSQYHTELGALWREISGDEQRFSTYSFDEAGFGIGFAIRKQ